MVSGVYPGLYAAVQALIDLFPEVPALTASLELPLSLVDGFTRAYLLCNLIPPAITNHMSPIVANSPWTLLLASLVREREFAISSIIIIYHSNVPITDNN